MPAYDFRCLECNRAFEILLSYDEYGKREIRCPHCGSDRVRRKINRIRVRKSAGEQLAELNSPRSLDGIEEDPQEFGRMIRKMGRETGEDLGPEFEEVVDRLESGQSPADIERSLPDMPAGEDSDTSLN